MITAAIVDDEPEALELLSRLLRKTELVKVVTKASDVDSGLDAILFHRPDLVFLDIEMPGRNGFDLVRELAKFEVMPPIIFVTAHENYAVEAIRHFAIDFIKKPIIMEALESAIHRFLKRSKENNIADQVKGLLKALNTPKLRFNTRTGFFYVNINDILYLHAEGAYTDIFSMGTSTKTVSLGLGLTENLLPKGQFVRINRSTVVNRNFISEINRTRKLCYLRCNGDSHELPITDKYIKLLEE